MVCQDVVMSKVQVYAPYQFGTLAKLRQVLKGGAAPSPWPLTPFIPQEHEKEIAELKNTIEQRKKAGWPPSATPHAVALRGLATAKFNLQCLKVNRPVFKFEAGPAVHKELLNRSKELGIVQSLALSQAGLRSSNPPFFPPTIHFSCRE